MKFLYIIKQFYLGLIIILATGSHLSAQSYTVLSPDGSLKITLHVSATIQYSVERDKEAIISPSAISMSLSNGLILGRDGTIANTSTRSNSETISRLYGKSTTLTDQYNELVINFTGKYSLIIRAYDEGVAYRFRTALAGTVNVLSEEANFVFASPTGVIFPESDQKMQNWERVYYTHSTIAKINAGTFSITPTMFTFSSGTRTVIAESDLYDYPGMYLQASDITYGMKGLWAQYPKTIFEPDNIYADHYVISREDFLATTTGTRDYPWRVIIVSVDDKDLLLNELIYKLARPSVLTNTSYIKPGRTAWEWWHDAILDTQHIPSGLNNLGLKLYKYYVDFAAQYKLEYLTLDAGWSESYVAELCQYAAAKNVKIFVWDYINPPIADKNHIAHLKSLGISGVKVDFVNRDDQIAVNWVEQVAKDCAEHEMMVMFHGCPKPTGLQRTYPNILNFEAVRGEECDKWDDTANPTYQLQFPFIRMLAGPLDFTPGSMRNVHSSEFKPTPKGIPMSMGTRAHELAMYVIFDQPLAYLCDSPTEYRKNEAAMTFLSSVPASWDKTLALAAKVEEYAVMARQKGNDWFVGAMTGKSARDLEIDFSFLPSGVQKTALLIRDAEITKDNESSESNAKAFVKEAITVTNTSKLSFHLASEGGLVIHVQDIITGSIEKNESPIYVSQSINEAKVTVHSNEGITSIAVLDIIGRVCHYEYVDNLQKSSSIDISYLSKGIYIVVVTTNSNQYSSKIIR